MSFIKESYQQYNFMRRYTKNIKYKLPNPDHYLSNIIIFAENVLNTIYNKEGQTIELQANINLNSAPYNPKILVYGPPKAIDYNGNISEIRLYNPKIIPSVKY